MSSGFDKLKSIGAQKIHEATHISRVHIKAILEENFEEMSSVQLNGFISILEREYSVDLSDLKQKSKEHFKNRGLSAKKVKAANVFMAHKKKQRMTTIYIASGVLLFVLFFIFTTTSSKEEEIANEDNVSIEAPISPLPVVEVEQNATILDEQNTTILDEQNSTIATQEVEAPPEEETPKAPVQSLSFKIAPKSKVWLGYFDVTEQKKYQKTFSDELSLDPSKEWLLVFGHGNITIDINSVITKFATTNTLRLLYKDQELKELSAQEYKDLNNGKLW